MRYPYPPGATINFDTYMEPFVDFDAENLAKKHHFIVGQDEAAAFPRLKECLLLLNPRVFPTEESTDLSCLPIFWDDKLDAGILPHTEPCVLYGPSNDFG